MPVQIVVIPAGFFLMTENNVMRARGKGNAPAVGGARTLSVRAVPARHDRAVNDELYRIITINGKVPRAGCRDDDASLKNGHIIILLGAERVPVAINVAYRPRAEPFRFSGVTTNQCLKRCVICRVVA